MSLQGHVKVYWGLGTLQYHQNLVNLQDDCTILYVAQVVIASELLFTLTEALTMDIGSFLFLNKSDV